MGNSGQLNGLEAGSIDPKERPRPFPAARRRARLQRSAQNTSRTGAQGLEGAFEGFKEPVASADPP